MVKELGNDNLHAAGISLAIKVNAVQSTTDRASQGSSNYCATASQDVEQSHRP